MYLGEIPKHGAGRNQGSLASQIRIRGMWDGAWGFIGGIDGLFPKSREDRDSVAIASVPIEHVRKKKEGKGKTLTSRAKPSATLDVGSARQ